MLMLDADKILNSLSFTAMVDELAAMHHEPIGLVDEMLMESKDDADNVNHFFIRTGWQAEKAVGAKVITVFPRNNQARQWPSIQAVYVLFEGVNGTPLACLDGTALTYVKTATDSALGSQLLSRSDIETMMMSTQLFTPLVRRNFSIVGLICTFIQKRHRLITWASLTDVSFTDIAPKSAPLLHRECQKTISFLTEEEPTVQE